MRDSLSPRRVGYAVAGLVVVFAAGTIGFHRALHEGWLQSFYRTVVTTSLAGLDTVPRGNGALVISILLVLAGLTIFAYVATILVEGIAGGVLTGALAERRRRRAIERLSDHYIICGYGRVGRRAALEFQHAGVAFVVLDFNPEAIERAREHRVLFIEGSGTEDADLEAAGLPRARGLIASSDSDADNLYIRPQRAGRAARPADRRPGLRRRRGPQAAAGRSRPGRPAVLDRGQGDGESRAAPSGRRVPRHRHLGRRPRAPFEEIRVTEECGQAGSRSATRGSATRRAR